MQNKAKRVRKVIAKLGWVSFAGYVITRVCGAEKIANVASILTVSCAVVVNGMKATEEIQHIITS
jgi:hypothetical protein